MLSHIIRHKESKKITLINNSLYLVGLICGIIVIGDFIFMKRLVFCMTATLLTSVLYAKEKPIFDYKNWRFHNGTQLIGGDKEILRRYARVIPTTREYPVAQIFDFNFNVKSFEKNYEYSDISKLFRTFLNIDRWDVKKESSRFVYYMKSSNKFNRIITLMIDKKKEGSRYHINYAFLRRGYLEHSLLETINLQSKLIISKTKTSEDTTRFIRSIKNIFISEAKADPCDPAHKDYDLNACASTQISEITEAYEKKRAEWKQQWSDTDKQKIALGALGGVAAVGFAGRAGSLLADALFKGVPTLVFNGVNELITQNNKKAAVEDIVQNMETYNEKFKEALEVEEALDRKVKNIIVPMFENAISLNVKLASLEEKYSQSGVLKIPQKCQDELKEKIDTLGEVVSGIEQYLDSICDKIRAQIEDIVKMEANLLAFSNTFSENQLKIKDKFLFRSKVPKLGKSKRLRRALKNNFELMKDIYKECASALKENSKLAYYSLKSCYKGIIRSSAEDYPNADEFEKGWKSCDLMIRKLSGDSTISTEDLENLPKGLKKYLKGKSLNAKNITDYYVRYKPMRKLFSKEERKELDYIANYEFEQEKQRDLIYKYSNCRPPESDFQTIRDNEGSNQISVQIDNKKEQRRMDKRVYKDILKKVSGVLNCNNEGCPIEKRLFKSSYYDKLLFRSTREGMSLDPELTAESGLCTNFNKEGSYYQRRVSDAIRKKDYIPLKEVILDDDM